MSTTVIYALIGVGAIIVAFAFLGLSYKEADDLKQMAERRAREDENDDFYQ